jgi:8-oxo-dGTP pyrophosphatase MutT (NUDIX family)
VLVLRRGDRFLVGQRAPHKPAPGFWTQVSGKIEAGEKQQQTVAREAQEEIGCAVRALRKLHQGLSSNGAFRLHYWLCELVDGEPAICDDELVALRWVTVDELTRMAPVFQQDIDVMRQLVGAENNGG